MEISKSALFNIAILFSSVFVAVTAKEEYTCVHNLRENRINNKGRNRLKDQPRTLRTRWQRCTDRRHRGLGWANGPEYDYFERTKMDVFSGRGPCLNGPVCALKVESDGTGPHHGWFCDYIKVSTTGPHMGCAEQKFDVDQWLASDAPPYELTALRNYCPLSDLGLNGEGSTVQVVPKLSS